ncbi:hypothetical protein RSK20926_05542 [Roseobacter sp. SK209-2-6]|uniref:contact-dependent growth inhibition system immunity protein n=1 Tax=Roseobacter sp. SK209-2-6 TaxID=388739 RepID=UPI0000F3CE8E|nr:contact-dependent growth inhibition system immunity protein [Roseobacter sp. SK209-2-6]EBA16050.1 hypothetical protein RSK20926_05542 [Roseobacter sp. SK209-2-6]
MSRSKTLEQLEGCNWPDPEFASHLVLTCHRLKKKPLNDFTVEDLRIMISQKFSLEFLLPIALERLKENPLCSGDFFEGDLLQAVLKVPADESAKLAFGDAFSQVVCSARQRSDELTPELQKLLEAYSDQPPQELL